MLKNHFLLLFCFFYFPVTALAQQWTTSVSGNHIYNNNTGNVGIGMGGAAPLSLLSVGGNSGVTNDLLAGFRYAPTATSGTLAALGVQVAPANTTNSTSSLFGLYTQMTSPTSSTADYYSFCGVHTVSIHKGTGNISYNYNILANTPNITSGGTITNSFGLYIKPQEVTGVTAGYGVYQLGANDLNYFQGGVTINTTSLPSDAKLAVNGKILSTEINVQAYPWSDYVFNETYPLRTLPELGRYISRYKHLPEVPTTAQVAENGINVGEMNALLLKKVEELTLYLLEKDKQLKAQDARLKRLERGANKKSLRKK